METNIIVLLGQLLSYAVYIAIFWGMSMLYGYLKKRYDLEELKTFIGDVEKWIMSIEKHHSDKTGEEKMDLVERAIEETFSEEEIEKIKRSPFRTVRRFAQSVFTNVAEPIIMAKNPLIGGVIAVSRNILTKKESENPDGE